MEALEISGAIESWLRAVFASNQYIDAQAPWTLRKTDPDRMSAVLAILYEAIGNLAIAIQPIIPEASGRLLDHMGISPENRTYEAISKREWYRDLVSSGFHVTPPTPIFPRLEMPADCLTHMRHCERSEAIQSDPVSGE